MARVTELLLSWGILGDEQIWKHGEFKRLTLDIINLRFLLDVQVKMTNDWVNEAKVINLGISI